MSCCKQRGVKSIPQEDLWWGKVLCVDPSKSRPHDEFRVLTRHIFVKAECKGDAEEKILTIARLENPDREIRKVCDTFPGKKGPYQVLVSEIN